MFVVGLAPVVCVGRSAGETWRAWSADRSHVRAIRTCSDQLDAECLLCKSQTNQVCFELSITAVTASHAATQELVVEFGSTCAWEDRTAA